MNKINRICSISFLILIPLIFFQEIIFCQTKTITNPKLVTGKNNQLFFKNGMLVQFPGGTKIFDNIHGTEIRKALSDTSGFEPVPGPIGGDLNSIAAGSGGYLYVATNGEVYRSSDNGLHWDLNLFPTQLHNFVEPVTVLAPNTIAAETDFSNFISTDRGESWDYLHDDVKGFEVDSDGVIYAGSKFNGVRKSTDSAKTWETFALAGLPIWKVVLCEGEKIACPSDSGTYYSTDRGRNWVYRRYDTPFTWNLVSDKKGNLFVLKYYGSGFLMYRSIDFGISWQRIVLPVGGDVLRIYIGKDGSVNVPVGHWIVKSTDGGNKWDLIYLPFENVKSVGWDSEERLLAGCYDGLYRYIGGQDKWEERDKGIHSRRIEKILLTAEHTILVVSMGKCFRSTDNGNSWHKAQVDSSALIIPYPPILQSSSGNIFMAATFDNYSECGLLRSSDDGVSWNRISILSNYYSIGGITEGPAGDICVATYFANIYRSTDDGETWSRVVSGSEKENISCIAADKDSNYYAVKDSTILISDNGTVWNEYPIERNRGYWESLSIDVDGNVYIATSPKGVFLSSDRGISWKWINDGLYDKDVLSSTADDSGNVVAGTCSGPFLLRDSTNSWSTYNNRFPHTFTTSLAVSPQGILFAGTQDFGLYRSTVPLDKRIATIELPDDSLPPGPGAITEITDFKLFQNYPNPFNPLTKILYSVPRQSFVVIKIYDILGNKIETLVNEQKSAGIYETKWDASKFPSGIYFYQLKATPNGGQAGNFIQTKKMILLK